MNVWMKEITAVLRDVVFNPHSDTQAITLLVVAVVFWMIVLRLTSGAFGLHNTGWLRIVIVTSVTTTLVLAAVCAIRLYVLQDSMAHGTRLALQIGAAVLAILILGLPVQCLLMRGSYFSSLFSMASALILAALITIGVQGAMGAVKSGHTDMKKVRDRNAAFDLDANALAPKSK